MNGIACGNVTLIIPDKQFQCHMQAGSGKNNRLTTRVRTAHFSGFFNIYEGKNTNENMLYTRANFFSPPLFLPNSPCGLEHIIANDQRWSCVNPR